MSGKPDIILEPFQFWNDFTLYYDQEIFKAFEALSPRPHFDEPESVDRTIKDNAEETWPLIQDPNLH